MYNQLKDCTEFRKRDAHDDFIRIDQRGMNTLCLEAKKQGINCWDRDVSRFVYSFQISSYHPFQDYMKHLPQWDGQDRVTGLAKGFQTTGFGYKVSDYGCWEWRHNGQGKK